MKNEKKINLDYINMWKEIPLFWLLALAKKGKSNEKSGKILILNSCLIGDFVSSLPAVNDFIRRNKDKIIDIMVSPPLEPLAKKMIGIRNVFVARSVHSRKSDDPDRKTWNFDKYEKVIALRMSWDSYRLIKNIKAYEIKTGARHFCKYGFHLVISLVFRRAPKHWRTVNFEMLGGEPKDVSLDEIFEFKEEDYAKIKELDAMKTAEKKIIIHTRSNWLMKRWDDKNWIALIKKIRVLGDFRFIFVGAKEDYDDYARISSELDFEVYSLIGKIDLMELLLALRASDYFIGIDSGPRNMAHLADTRSVTILGPGPHMFMPTNKNDTVLDKSNGRGLYQMFFYKKNGFIHKIKVDDVWQEFQKLHNLKFPLNAIGESK